MYVWTRSQKGVRTLKLNYKKGLLAGLAILVVSIGFNWLLGIILPEVAKEYQNTAIFRPWSDPLMVAYFAYPFILGLILAYFWDLTAKQFTGDEVNKAFQFAKIYFIIATIPGMFISYTSFQLSFQIILVWTLVGFLEAFVAGFIFASPLRPSR